MSPQERQAFSNDLLGIRFRSPLTATQIEEA